MTVLDLIKPREGSALMRRRGRLRSRAARALARRLPSSTQGDDGRDALRVYKGMLGAATGVVAILAVKLSMVWTALRGL